VEEPVAVRPRRIAMPSASSQRPTPLVFPNELRWCGRGDSTEDVVERQAEGVVEGGTRSRWPDRSVRPRVTEDVVECRAEGVVEGGTRSRWPDAKRAAARLRTP
jgi:hypothetical protein